MTFSQLFIKHRYFRMILLNRFESKAFKFWHINIFFLRNEIFNDISYCLTIYQSKDHRTKRDPKNFLSLDTQHITMQNLQGRVTKAQKSL